MIAYSTELISIQFPLINFFY